MFIPSDLCSTSMIPLIFGRRADGLRAILLEERLPEGWEPRVRKPYGLTLHTLNFTALLIWLGIREADWAEDAKQAAEEST